MEENYINLMLQILVPIRTSSTRQLLTTFLTKFNKDKITTLNRWHISIPPSRTALCLRPNSENWISGIQSQWQWNFRSLVDNSISLSTSLSLKGAWIMNNFLHRYLGPNFHYIWNTILYSFSCLSLLWLIFWLAPMLNHLELQNAWKKIYWLLSEITSFIQSG